MKYIYILSCVILLAECRQNHPFVLYDRLATSIVKNEYKHDNKSKRADTQPDFNTSRYEKLSDFMSDISGIYILDTISDELSSSTSDPRNIIIIRPYLSKESAYNIFYIHSEPFFDAPEVFHFLCDYQSNDTLTDRKGDIQIEIQYKEKKIEGLWIYSKKVNPLWFGDTFFLKQHIKLKYSSNFTLSDAHNIDIKNYMKRLFKME